MSESFKRILPAAILIVALIAALIWGGMEKRRQDDYRRTLQNMYERSFYELVDNVGNMEVQISKLLITETPVQSLTLLNSVSHKADNAQASFSMLPVGIENVSDTAKFVNQVGDYCLTLAQSVSDGIPISNEQREQLLFMRERLTVLGNDMREIQVKAASGEQLLWESALSGKESDPAEAAPLDNIGNSGVDYPSLVYDGPFSDASARPPKGLSGEWINYAQAEQIARAFVEDQRVEWARETSEGFGEIPTWGVEMMLSRDGVVTVQVTKQGGHVQWMVCERLPLMMDIDLNAGYENAVRFLAEKGYPACDLSYYQAYGNLLTLNFVPIQGDILLYPDLIKVQVSLETGLVVGFEAGNYLRNHVARELEGPQIEAEEAAMIAARLSPERTRLCVIPKLDQEILCYEVTGTFLGERYLMYIDAANGNEVELFKILDVEGGQLAM